MRSIRCTLILFALCLHTSGAALPSFDFTQPNSAQGWGQTHDVNLQPTPDGLRAEITGPDPYFSGPPRDYPAGENLWMLIDLRSDSAGMAQLFYFQTGATEEKSVRFYVPAGDSAELRVPLPPLGAQTRLRFDPPGTKGSCIIRRISFELRPKLTAPAWTKPTPPQLDSSAITLDYEAITFRHHPSQFGAFEISVDGKVMAIGHSRTPIGYTIDGKARWLELTNRATVSKSISGITIKVRARDEDGAEWFFQQTFNRGARGSIAMSTHVTVSKEREATFLPMVLLFSGVGAFGTNKTQALFAGVEYLENEPSSAAADVIGPGALRRVPDTLKLTFPLMVIAAEDRYLALDWWEHPHFAPLFDTPDRVFNSGGHLMGVIFPGSHPSVREDGNLLPYGGIKIDPKNGVLLNATIIAGAGNSAVPALKDYLRFHPGTPKPDPGYSPAEYYNLTALGWLDSQIRDGARFRHAVGGTFGSHPAADAVLYMEWLATKVEDPQLSARLKDTATAALTQVPPAAYNSAAVGHIRTPVQALVFGHVLENARTARDEARNILRHFEPDGSVIFKAPATGNDLGRTHFSREANGLAATYVSALLEKACFAGDQELIQQGLRLLRSLNKFSGTVPRGAQTWEIPLHTPDILASAYLVRAYTRGFELTGDPEFLEQVRYWAWTGIPFVYMRPPVDGPVGTYATIAVLGATQWVAPLWIGLPVQWCGLVYSHAIRQLAPYDDSAPWKEIADGIALSGVQQTHPLTDKGIEGLLPDSFEPRHQVRNPVPINPGTLQVEAIVAYGEPPLYDFHAFRSHGILVHAPGPIQNPEATPGSITFTIEPWSSKTSFILLNGLSKKPVIHLDDQPLPDSFAEFDPAAGNLVLSLTNKATIRLEFSSPSIRR